MIPLAIPTGNRFSRKGQGAEGKPSWSRISTARIPPMNPMDIASVKYCLPIIL